MRINVTESCVVGPAACSSKAYKQARWRKGNLALDSCWQLGGRVADVCAKANSPPPPPQAGGQELLWTEVGRGLHAITAWSALTVIFKLVIGGLAGIILVA